MSQNIEYYEMSSSMMEKIFKQFVTFEDEHLINLAKKEKLEMLHQLENYLTYHHSELCNIAFYALEIGIAKDFQGF